MPLFSDHTSVSILSYIIGKGFTKQYLSKLPRYRELKGLPPLPSDSPTANSRSAVVKTPDRTLELEVIDIYEESESSADKDSSKTKKKGVKFDKTPVAYSDSDDDSDSETFNKVLCATCGRQYNLRSILKNGNEKNRNRSGCKGCGHTGDMDDEESVVINPRRRPESQYQGYSQQNYQGNSQRQSTFEVRIEGYIQGRRFQGTVRGTFQDNSFNGRPALREITYQQQQSDNFDNNFNLANASNSCHNCDCSPYRNNLTNFRTLSIKESFADLKPDTALQQLVNRSRVHQMAPQPNYIFPSRADVVRREDVVEQPSDPRPNAFFDTKSGTLRVYHGSHYGNPYGRIIVNDFNHFEQVGTFPPGHLGGQRGHQGHGGGCKHGHGHVQSQGGGYQGRGNGYQGHGGPSVGYTEQSGSRGHFGAGYGFPPPLPGSPMYQEQQRIQHSRNTGQPCSCHDCNQLYRTSRGNSQQGSPHSHHHTPPNGQRSSSGRNHHGNNNHSSPSGNNWGKGSNNGNNRSSQPGNNWGSGSNNGNNWGSGSNNGNNWGNGSNNGNKPSSPSGNDWGNGGTNNHSQHGSPPGSNWGSSSNNGGGNQHVPGAWVDGGSSFNGPRNSPMQRTSNHHGGNNNGNSWSGNGDGNGNGNGNNNRSWSGNGNAGYNNSPTQSANNADDSWSAPAQPASWADPSAAQNWAADTNLSGGSWAADGGMGPTTTDNDETW